MELSNYHECEPVAKCPFHTTHSASVTERVVVSRGLILVLKILQIFHYRVKFQDFKKMAKKESSSVIIFEIQFRKSALKASY